MCQQKRVGILTFHRAMNYGAVWQCWALKKTCEKLGFNVETIDFTPFGFWKYKWFINFKRPDKMYAQIKGLYQFNKFIEKRLNLVCHTDSSEFTKKNLPEYDFVIVGSDQVWSESVVGEFLHSYLLDFVPQKTTRIAYAASTGGGGTMPNSTNAINELRKFKAISLREKESIANIQSFVDCNVVDVCDPSLLLKKEDYTTEEKKYYFLPKHYILVFDLNGDKLIKECAVRLKQIYNIPIVCISMKYIKWADKMILAPTPEQWLYIFHRADFICTNSFHGTAFSIIYRKPFIACDISAGTKSKRVGRITNLLIQIDLESQYITNVNQVDLASKMSYKSVEDKIETYRCRSIDWLKSVLNQQK